MAMENGTVVFFHPDLGIGGAERLVVDAALGLQELGHRVVIVTSHCDPTHCFEEARDGRLDVRVRGDWLVPRTILGRFAILCAALRQCHLLLHVGLLTAELAALDPAFCIVDQLSAGIPLLRLLLPSSRLRPRARILFYCHFPDKLLATGRLEDGHGGEGDSRRGSAAVVMAVAVAVADRLRRLYRAAFDALECWSTGCADGVVVNSRFTGRVFASAFPPLAARGLVPAVVYPCVHVESGDAGGAVDVEEQDSSAPPLRTWHGRRLLLSINRFEVKKNIGLAIRAFAAVDPRLRKDALLVIAGGYDARVPENVNYHSELVELCAELHLPAATARTAPDTVACAVRKKPATTVLFLPSISTSLKDELLGAALLLLYTPRHEHFGIVPLEAMRACTPVLAAADDQAGPSETIIEGRTGWLRLSHRVSDWADVVAAVLAAGIKGSGSNIKGESTVEPLDAAQLWVMGRRGRQRVVEEFSREKMAVRLNEEMKRLLDSKERPMMSLAMPSWLVLFSVISIPVALVASLIIAGYP